MGALTVFHKDIVPVELRVAGQRADGVELILRVLAAGHGLSQHLGEILQLVAGGIDPALHLGLLFLDLADQIGVADGALTLDEGLVLQRAGEIVAGDGLAVFGLGLTHMAVGTGVGIPVLAALGQIGFQLGVLHLI